MKSINDCYTLNNGVQIPCIGFGTYKAATGKYLSFLDSDDFFDLNMLEDMYNKAEEDGSDVVVCGYRGYNNKTHQYIKEYKIDPMYMKMSPFEPSKMGNQLFHFSSLNAWSKLFRKKLVESHFFFWYLLTFRTFFAF